MKNQVNQEILLPIYLVAISLLSAIIVFCVDNRTLQQNIKQPKLPMEVETVEVPLEEITSVSPEIEVNKYSYEDLEYLSSIIWCEAGNQCVAGKEAVGIVVMNRVSNDNFEDTVKGVIYEKGQFSPVSSGRINKALDMFSNGTIPNECVQAAVYALEGNVDVIYGEDFYEIPYLYFNGVMDNPQLKIEDHYFK